MSARRLGRLLGSVLAAAVIAGGTLSAPGPERFAQAGYDWSASYATSTVEAMGGTAVEDGLLASIGADAA